MARTYRNNSGFFLLSSRLMYSLVSPSPLSFALVSASQLDKLEG